MHTSFSTEEKYADVLLSISKEVYAGNGIVPERFNKIMYEHRGVVNYVSPFNKPEDGLEPRNPIIVAVGDSVTAGHFEFVGDTTNIFKLLEKGHIDENDGYKVWEEYEKEGNPIVPLLANGINHPSREGHEAFANVLMRVLEG